VLVAAVSADSAWYILGRTRRIRSETVVPNLSGSRTPASARRANWFKRLGAWALVVAKFVPGLSTIATADGGVLPNGRLGNFFTADVAGTLLWGTSIMGIGLRFFDRSSSMWVISRRGWARDWPPWWSAWWRCGFAWKQWQRQRFIRSLKVARITPEEVLARLAEIAIVDLRSSVELELDGMKTPRRAVVDRKELGLHRDKIPRDRDVILYCT